ncbi:speract receptor-like [Mizuhopecten yessoensis]|uniref:speract receptor-like n=1 Tax=Mizuhopecten yessoensis TaxID=6573 RepID=UPI000B45A326|nr:speract receptor-like [Mizuhopecten yessoensis]
MRISIHTSDCVYKLSSHPEPRFHIYGELVDVATQLKQSCSANRIHISEQVGTMLRKEHLYNVQRRGFIILPSGRYLATQWLLGRRVSVCYPNNDVMKKISFMPIQLAETPIYRFDKEKVKYVSPYWMSPQYHETTSMSPALSESSYSESECSFNGSSGCNE